jgi:CRISPR-associated endonuclease/helicase Cas3
MSNLPTKLWAKSKRGDREITLEDHLCDTEACAEQIFRLDDRWGRNWCRFFQIQGAEVQQQFLLNLQVAALFHDIGKANEDFFTAVTQPGFTPQTIRHEHLSALVLCLPEIRTWLSQNPVLDVDVITAAVLSHHLKASKGETNINGRSYKWCQPQPGVVNKSVKLYLRHQEVNRILERIARVADLKTLPTLPDEPWKVGSIWDKVYRKGVNFADDFEGDLEDSQERRLLLVAVKAGLIVSDAVASGLVREGHKITDWIEAIVHSEAIATNEIAEKILIPRIQQIEKKTKQPFIFRAFQIQAAEQGSKALLLVACGGGKTLGAWKWAEQQSKEHQIGKIIFLYPTRGTATEGFRDYVGWAPEADAALVTGTAKYELEAMADNPNEAIANKNYRFFRREYV